MKGLTDSEGINQLIHMQNVCCGGQQHSPFAAWLIKVDWETKVAVLRAREDGVFVQIQVKATDVIWIHEYEQISSKKQQTDFQLFLHVLWDFLSRPKSFYTILSATRKKLFCPFGRGLYNSLYYSVVIGVNMTLVGVCFRCASFR